MYLRSLLRTWKCNWQVRDELWNLALKSDLKSTITLFSHSDNCRLTTICCTIVLIVKPTSFRSIFSRRQMSLVRRANPRQSQDFRLTPRLCCQRMENVLNQRPKNVSFDDLTLFSCTYRTACLQASFKGGVLGSGEGGNRFDSCNMKLPDYNFTSVICEKNASTLTALPNTVSSCSNTG